MFLQLRLSRFLLFCKSHEHVCMRYLHVICMLQNKCIILKTALTRRGRLVNRVTITVIYKSVVRGWLCLIAACVASVCCFFLTSCLLARAWMSRHAAATSTRQGLSWALNSRLLARCSSAPPRLRSTPTTYANAHSLLLQSNFPKRSRSRWKE